MFSKLCEYAIKATIFIMNSLCWSEVSQKEVAAAIQESGSIYSQNA